MFTQNINKMKKINIEETFNMHFVESKDKDAIIKAMREICYTAIDLHQRNVNKELADICSTDQIIDEIAEQTKKQII